MRYLSPLLVVFVALTFAVPAGAKQMYEAQTTVMDLQPLVKGGDLDKRMAALVALARSQTVLQNVAEALASMHITDDPSGTLGTMEVEPIKDTSILKITVQSESEDLAKVTADIAAHEFVRYYNETLGIKAGKPGLKILEPAKSYPRARSFSIFGLGLRALQYVSLFLLTGIVIGIPIGFLIGRRARSKRPEPV